MTGNQLGRETSPYLLQHKDNPVHWRPWGEAAFAEARESGRPILLSVGYAACHWCHVMAHESFEDDAVAALMNAHFIPVKVDREERPDVDMLYQRALALMGDHGGWPLTMFLTPAGEPFWGGTYFPPEEMHGRPAFRTVLTELAKAYDEQAGKVRKSAEVLRQALSSPSQGFADGQYGAFSRGLLDHATDQLLEHVDFEEGGLQGAPKFPMPFIFAFLWRSWKRRGDDRARAAVTTTLTHMAEGGIFDHLGGGFARYSTDGRWLVPHFEKMLYDNAQIIDLMTQVWQETRDPLLAERVATTIDWLTREMIAEEGAFAATLDADSEGEEGRFYVWTAEEVDALLPAETAALFHRAYDVSREGNWENGRSVLHRNHPGAWADGPEADRLADARNTLFQAREKRVRPERDDKVLADWNGLMIAALARAGLAFERDDWVALAERAFAGVLTLLERPDNRLAHASRAGKAVETAMLEDYGAMARAALFLHEATGRRDLIHRAAAWVETADRLYRDTTHGGWFTSSEDDPTLFIRPKTTADAATPSGNGLMVEACARLFWLTGDASWRRMADGALDALAEDAVRHFPSSATLFNAYELLAAGQQVVIAGPADDAATLALQRAALQTPAPHLILQLRPPEAHLPEDHPAAGKDPLDGRPTAYVCHGPTCAPPVTTAEALREALERGYPASPA